MKQRVFVLLLSVSLLLGGCTWMDGSYVSVTLHREQRQTNQTEVISASNYLELLEALKGVISEGTEVAAINVANYPEEAVDHGMQRAVQYAMINDPIGAYAVENILYELGTSSGKPAVSVSVTYHHPRSEIQRIHKAESMEQAEQEISQALEGYESALVMHIEGFEKMDFTQFVHDYSDIHPNTVMEVPQVTENVYGTGRDRVVELLFTYQTSRDALRRMQSQVQPVFASASLYVSGDGEDHQKFSQLFAFLMERFDYKVETSITPAYSLLRHCVGDSRAFATIYAAMCRSAGLECMTVTGTRSGEPWTWNMVLDGEQYFHVDLLRSSEQGRFREYTDDAMENYVWDYSEYPACNGERIAEESQPETMEPEPTVNSEKNKKFEN